MRFAGPYLHEKNCDCHRCQGKRFLLDAVKWAIVAAIAWFLGGTAFHHFGKHLPDSVHETLAPWFLAR